MTPAEQGTRTTPPPPISTLLVEDLSLFEVVLSWARGEVPSTGNFDIRAAAAAMHIGREMVRNERKRVIPNASIAAGYHTVTGVQHDDPANMVPFEEQVRALEEALRAGMAAAEGTAVGAEAAPWTAAATSARLRAHATGLVSASLFSRNASDFVVNKGFGVHLVRSLREGPVAAHLRAEAARGQRQQRQQQQENRQGAGISASAAGVATSTASANQESGADSRVGQSAGPAQGGDDRGDTSADTGSSAGIGAGGAAVAFVGGRGSTAQGYGRWSSVTAVEAEHVAACLSGVGGYQEVSFCHVHWG